MSSEEKSLVDVAKEMIPDELKAIEEMRTMKRLAEEQRLKRLKAVKEMCMAAKIQAEAKRREKIKVIEEAVRNVMREELRRSPRKEALDLASEKNKDVSDIVEVRLVESSFSDKTTNEIMNVVRNLAPEMLRTKSLENIIEKTAEVIGICAVPSVDYAETGGNVPIHASLYDCVAYMLIQINGTGFLQFHCDTSDC